jgi:hypothetical protein
MLNHSKPLRQRHGLSTAGFRMIVIENGEFIDQPPASIDQPQSTPARRS